mgnify:CR=1 FL=1
MEEEKVVSPIGKLKLANKQNEILICFSFISQADDISLEKNRVNNNNNNDKTNRNENIYRTGVSKDKIQTGSLKKI